MNLIYKVESDDGTFPSGKGYPYLASGIEEYFGGYIVVCDFCVNYETDEENAYYDEFRSRIRKAGWRVYGEWGKDSNDYGKSDEGSMFKWKYGYKCPICVKEQS